MNTGNISNAENRIPLETAPNMTGLISNIGSSYIDMTQPINELIDDSISALRSNIESRNPKFIRVTLEELADSVNITVEDSGGGIKDLDEAFRIAGMAGRQTPFNEHGMGLKQVIAYITKHGGDWSLVTRDEASRECGMCWAVMPPYNKLDKPMEAEALSNWPGELASTGTIIVIPVVLPIFGCGYIGRSLKIYGCAYRPLTSRLKLLTILIRSRQKSTL